MKTVTRYQSTDGELHDTAEAAEKRDALISKCAQAMAPLGDTPKAVKEGKGWVQHRPETVVACRDAILELCCQEGFAKTWPVFFHRGPEVHPRSIIGRILDDNGGLLAHAWNRFNRIDEAGREHQQSYFAYTAGPDTSHVCVEDRSSLPEAR